jgi:site-specific recombinase XerD
MVDMLIAEIKQGMMSFLDNAQMEKLDQVLKHSFFNLTIQGNNDNSFILDNQIDNKEMLNAFISAKRVEGCSDRTLKYYLSTINNMHKCVKKSVKRITTDDLRQYLAEYHKKGRASKVSMDNIRRILSSFFSWMEDENIIVKSPVRRIHKLKIGKMVKETYTDESVEILRDYCESPRDLAIIDLLSSTGMRVGELVRLNRDDIDFNNRECIVFGKGDKERPVYFDAKTKLHLQNYLKKRTDNNPALFVSLLKPYKRLQISGVEIRLRELGRRLNILKVHPHKFRRTLATRAIDKGMPIEQVQQLLGHQKIDTTLQYAMVSQNNVKISHRKFIS